MPSIVGSQITGEFYNKVSGTLEVLQNISFF